MNARSERHFVGRFLIRHYVALITLGLAVFVVQAGLVPFDFAPRGDGHRSLPFASNSVTGTTLPDIISNVFLYVPLGAMLCVSVYRRVGNTPLCWLATLTLAAMLSGCIEWLQAYSVYRVSSLIDLTSNVIGAALGASLASVVRCLIPGMVHGAIAEVHNRPRAAILKVYGLLLMVFAAAPFSFSFDSIRLKQSLQSAVLVPFQEPDWQQAVPAAAWTRGDYYAQSYMSWARMKRWARWAAECASFLVFVFLLRPVLEREYRFRPWAAVVLTLYVGGVLAVLLTAMQLPIVTRACDVTDILFRWLGLAFGVVAWSLYRRTPDGAFFEDARACRSDADVALVERRALRRRAGLACAVSAVIAYVLFTGLIPLTFDVERDRALASFAAPGFLPFVAYYVSRFDIMMADVLEKFTAYALFAVLLAAHGATRRSGNAGDFPFVRITVYGVALSCGVEACQLFIPVRVASLTDPILAAVGCGCGVLVYRAASRFYAHSRSIDAVTAEPQTRFVRADRPLSPADEMIAALTDEHAAAPAEQLPIPARTHRHRGNSQR